MKSIEAVVWEIADKYLPSLGVKSFADLFALTNPSSLRFAPRLLPLMDWIDSFEQLAYSSGSYRFDYDVERFRKLSYALPECYHDFAFKLAHDYQDLTLIAILMDSVPARDDDLL